MHCCRWGACSSTQWWAAPHLPALAAGATMVRSVWLPSPGALAAGKRHAWQAALVHVRASNLEQLRHSVCSRVPPLRCTQPVPPMHSVCPQVRHVTAKRTSCPGRCALRQPWLRSVRCAWLQARKGLQHLGCSCTVEQHSGTATLHSHHMLRFRLMIPILLPNLLAVQGLPCPHGEGLCCTWASSLLADAPLLPRAVCTAGSSSCAAAGSGCSGQVLPGLEPWATSLATHTSFKV